MSQVLNVSCINNFLCILFFTRVTFGADCLMQDWNVKHIDCDTSMDMCIAIFSQKFMDFEKLFEIYIMFQLGMSIIWGSDYLYKYQIVQIPKTQVLVSKTNS